MNGVLISGFVSIDFAKSVHPAALIEDLKKLDYRLDVDAQKARVSMEDFLEDVDKTLDARIAAAEYLWDSCDWKTFMLVFTGTDRLMHFLWNAYEEKDHQYHNQFIDHFRKIDAEIGQIADKLTDDDLLIMHSDHGFEKLQREVYINSLLEREGFLSFKPGTDKAVNNISTEAKAFALDPARIHLNLKGKYPCGSVDPADAESVLTDLENIFKSLEIDGKKVIRSVYRNEEIFTGPYASLGPDLTLVGNEGFDLKARMNTDELFGNGIFTGKHTQDTAFLLVKGLADETAIPEAPAITDIRSIAEKKI